jgi:hypothetical protein
MHKHQRLSRCGCQSEGVCARFCACLHSMFCSTHCHTISLTKSSTHRLSHFKTKEIVFLGDCTCGPHSSRTPGQRGGPPIYRAPIRVKKQCQSLPSCHTNGENGNSKAGDCVPSAPAPVPTTAAPYLLPCTGVCTPNLRGQRAIPTRRW